MFKATFFACVIAAAGVGCRNADRNARETSYSNPVESSTYNTGTEATSRDMQSADTIRTDEAGHTVHETETQARPGAITTRSSGVTTRERADIDEDADTSSIPTAGGTDRIRSGNGNVPAGADTSTGAATPESSEMSGAGAGANADTTSGLNETSSGTGTTTNTGVNTENAGTGGTDDPRR
jgi:hypothetical protein